MKKQSCHQFYTKYINLHSRDTLKFETLSWRSRLPLPILLPSHMFPAPPPVLGQPSAVGPPPSGWSGSRFLPCHCCLWSFVFKLYNTLATPFQMSKHWYWLPPEPDEFMSYIPAHWKSRASSPNCLLYQSAGGNQTTCWVLWLPAQLNYLCRILSEELSCQGTSQSYQELEMCLSLQSTQHSDVTIKTQQPRCTPCKNQGVMYTESKSQCFLVDLVYVDHVVMTYAVWWERQWWCHTEISSCALDQWGSWRKRRRCEVCCC